ncbi:bifunctional DNA primase/polymerase [Singulisphaera sp. PoT]|uniref:bifunctional DNA primase/polymerase n=1 Tax=Singulisphaera sp. PoT TaxID=3411797 RepID=UPI003BF47FCA
MSIVTDQDVALARNWATFYRQRGFNPLPMRQDAKRPLVRFARWWEEPAPADLFDQWETPSIQVMTGRRWRLLVIDLDGPEARDWFLSRGMPVPTTWSTHSGGDGLHLWFRLPNWLGRELPKAFLWKGEGEHSAVERLCDRSLIVAPPSIHPRTGERYRFSSKAQSPARLPMPAPCPKWILDLPPIQAPRPPAATPAASFVPAKRQVDQAVVGRYQANDVLDAIGDKLSVAEGWGVRLASRSANSAGWCQCHAIHREDRTPSASVSIETGRYWEPGERSISLFELGVRLGVYGDWREAVADLGERFGARRSS